MSAALAPSPPDPAAVVGNALARLPAAERAPFLRELLAHAAAGLVVIAGDREAAEAVYRLADAVALRPEPQPINRSPAP
jgi:hypothetical protein